MADDKNSKKSKKQVQMNELFDGTKKKNKDCPKCGPGYTLAKHKNRESCGKCGYAEFASKKE